MEDKAKILAEYKTKAEEIIRRMFGILARAQKKADMGSYKRTLEKLKK